MSNNNNYVSTKNMNVVDVPLTDIYCDDDFNVRGAIRMTDVVELAKNINTHGLLQPIGIQPYDKMKNQGYTKRIILGHRRFHAFKYLQKETIPSIIYNDLTETQALAMNFNENVARKDLNILEEAHGIKRFLDNGESIESVAKLINKGKNWVVIRRELLKMPAEIQQDAAASWLTQAQIFDLISVNSAEEQLKIVRKIKEAKGRGERRLPKIVKKELNPIKCKRRTPDEIMDLIEHLLDETGVASPFTRTLAWCNGDINSIELERDVIDYFDSIGIPYNSPVEFRYLLQPDVKPEDLVKVK